MELGYQLQNGTQISNTIINVREWYCGNLQDSCSVLSLHERKLIKSCLPALILVFTLT